MSPRLALNFLGIPQLNLDGKPITTDRRKAVALLAYLAINHGDNTREFLSGLFWPDYEQAKAFSNLRRTIWEVHQAIGDEWLLADRESVSLNSESELDLDVARFRDLLSQGCGQSDPTLRVVPLAEAAKLYRNHFLTGFSLKDAFPFNEWAYAEAEELRHQLADALNTLSEDYCALGQAETAIPHARRLISLDPLNEASHRQLMEVYFQAGQHSAALKQYQTCEQLLRKELNLDPQPETRMLYKKIRKREIKSVQDEKQIKPIKPKHNLPLQLSTFIGRENEQSEIMRLLEKNRLVTLAGVGGIGKTRLSLQVGQKLLEDYPDGVWFVPLDSLSNPALVPQTVAYTFDIREGPNRPILEILMNVLHEKTTLFILDNCEHLLDACAQLITTLLQNCTNLKVLATSREILDIEGEAAYYLPSLSIPRHNEVSLEKLTEYESVQLFTERAALNLTSFTLTEEDAGTVVDICRKLDGIPLALELAAARVNILNVEEISKQLHKSFSILANNRRTTLSRHQTLQASLDWSWSLLTNAEQVFLRQLSVFAGGWTLESGQAVCGGNTLNLISSLVKKSLIIVDQNSEGETRYHLHEIVRKYAHEQLVASEEEKDVRTRHLQYVLRLSEEAEPALRGPAQIEWMARLNDERDNIRAALAWADKTNVEAGLYISGRLRHFWESFDFREGNSWLLKFLQRPESHVYPRARAKALYAPGLLLDNLQNFDGPLLAAKECLELYRSVGDQEGEVDGLLFLGRVIESTQGAELTQQALALARSLGDIWRQAWALVYLGENFEVSEPIDYWEQAITLFRQSGDWRSLAEILTHVANFIMLTGDLESAQQRLDEAALLNDQLNDKVVKSLLLYVCGRMAMIRGEYNQAHKYLQEELETVEKLGTHTSLLWCHTQFGYLALHEGNLSPAYDIFEKTVRSFQEDQNVIGVVFSLEGISKLYITLNKPVISARLIGRADVVRKEINDARPAIEQADVDKVIAACVAKLGKAKFSDAYNEGQKMTLDEAVKYALEENHD